MAEFNWTEDDIKRAQRDFSNNFMQLDCIKTESYDVAIDCMTECIEKKAADVQPVRYGRWVDDKTCSNCGFDILYNYGISGTGFCPNCGADMRGDPDV